MFGKVAAFALAFAAASTSRAADACSCMMSPTNCSYLATADAVFEATVESIELRTAAPPPPDMTVPPGSIYVGGSRRVVKLKDVKAMRGDVQSTIITGMGGGDCGFPFEVGTRYLIEAGRDRDGNLTASLCGQTRPVGAAVRGASEYVASLNEPEHSRVWGYVFNAAGWRNDTGPARVAGARVTLSGPTQVTVTTDSDGYFVATALPRGKYQASAVVPGSRAAIRSIWNEFELSDKPNACAELIFQVPAQGRIRGRVVDEHDNPIGGAFLKLEVLARPARENEGGGLGIETDQDGRYEFGELPPGIYRVGANADSGPTPGDPYQGAFATTAAGEVTFALSSGQTMTLEPIRVRRSSNVKVPVVLRNAAGAAVPGTEIKVSLLLPSGKREPVWTKAVSDVDGRLEIDLWKDQRYSITVGPPVPFASIEFIATGQPVVITVTPR